MDRRSLLAAGGLAALATACCAGGPPPTPHEGPRTSERVEALSPANADSGTTVVAALGARRSQRKYASRKLNTEEIAQLCWAAQGQQAGSRHRTAPSAGALYPLEVLVILESGLWRYRTEEHEVEVLAEPEVQAGVVSAVGQDPVAAAPAIFVITGVLHRLAGKYGERAERYLWLEAGHAAQNLVLAALDLGLSSVTIGAFDDAALHAALRLPDDEAALYVIPVGTLD